MKPPERFAPDDPREWLNRARSNLALAKSNVPGAYLEDLCFEAQQAAEKAIKAVMIRRNIEFPYVHDLARLLSLLEATGEAIPEVVRKADELTRYALLTRYPGLARPVSEREYTEAVAIAEAWALD
jgi:HEPN domain-containing protein